MHFVVYFVFAAVQISDGGMMVWIVGVIVAYHGKYMYMASMCLQRSLLRTCIFQNSARWGAVTKGVLVCRGMHQFLHVGFPT